MTVHVEQTPDVKSVVDLVLYAMLHFCRADHWHMVAGPESRLRVDECTVTSVAVCQVARKISPFPPGDLAVHDSQSFLAAA